MSKDFFIKDYILDLLKTTTIRKDTDLLSEVSSSCGVAEDYVASVLSDLIRDGKVSSFYWFNKEESGTLFMSEGSRII